MTPEQILVLYWRSSDKNRHWCDAYGIDIATDFVGVWRDDHDGVPGWGVQANDADHNDELFDFIPDDLANHAIATVDQWKDWAINDILELL